MLPALLGLLGSSVASGAAGKLGGLLGGSSLLSTPLASAPQGIGEGLNLSSGANQVGGYAAPQGLSSGVEGVQPFNFMQGRSPEQSSEQQAEQKGLFAGKFEGQMPQLQQAQLTQSNHGGRYQRQFPTAKGFR